MVGKVNYLKVASVLVAGLLLGCDGFEPGKKAFAVFIDYTSSASTFEDGNRAKVQAIVQGLAAAMDQEDLLEICPIHAFTESATPILRLSGPELMGDLNDEMRRKEWMEKTVGPAVETIATVRFARDRTARTNIYPVVGKVSRLVEAGYEVRVVLVCDLIQDYDSEDFSILLRKGSDADPGRLAHRKVSELGFMDMLQGVEVVILIPGSPSGNRTYDRIRGRVNAFWEEFFYLCGTSLTIRNL